MQTTVNSVNFKKILLLLAEHRALNFLEILALSPDGPDEEELEKIIAELQTQRLVDVQGPLGSCEQIITLRHKGYGAAAETSAPERKTNDPWTEEDSRRFKNMAHLHVEGLSDHTLAKTIVKNVQREKS